MSFILYLKTSQKLVDVALTFVDGKFLGLLFRCLDDEVVGSESLTRGLGGCLLGSGLDGLDGSLFRSSLLGCGLLGFYLLCGRGGLVLRQFREGVVELLGFGSGDSGCFFGRTLEERKGSEFRSGSGLGNRGKSLNGSNREDNEKEGNLGLGEHGEKW